MAENNSLLVPRFFKHVQPNETASKSAGRPIFTEFDAIEIRFGGDRQKVAVFPAHEIEPNATRERGEPTTYAMLYGDLYRKFKSDESQDLTGTPLSELPFLTEARRRELKALNIHTAEALASLDGTPLKQIGMGGRELKNQAQAYLDNAAGSADVTALAAEVEALRRQLRDRDELIEEIGKSGAKQKGKDGGSDAPEDEDGTPSPFQEWGDDDIKNWIADATGSKPKGNPSHETLVRLADEANAELAAKGGEK